MTWQKQLAVFLASVTALAIVAESYCPDEELIQPCYCQRNERTILTCSHIDSVDVLKMVANHSDGYTYTEMHIEQSTLEYIPADVLKIRTEYLILKDLELTRMVDNIPNGKGNDRLKHLVLQRINCKEGLSCDVLAHLTDLESLLVDSLDVPTINKDFNKCVTPNLIRLYLKNTNTKNIEAGAFDGFNNLTALSLTNNDMKTIKRESFPRPFLVEVLMLTNNKFTEIPDDIISDMPNLKAFFMNDNNLTTINEPLFTGRTSDLRYANFNGNPIHCDCKLKWITKLKPECLEGVCQTPRELKGKDLRQLEEEDLKC